MKDDNCADCRELLGAHALGGLREPELGRILGHLERCEACRREHEKLRAVVGALGETAPVPDESPPPELEERVVSGVLGAGYGTAGSTSADDTSGVRRSRSGPAGWRRGLIGLGVAAAAVIFVVVGVFAFDSLTGGPEEYGLGDEEPITFVETPASVAADGTVIAHTWGTELVLEVEGLQSGEVYTATLESADGSPVPAGTFVGVEGVKIDCQLNGAVLREDTRSVSITDESGERVLHSEL